MFRAPFANPFANPFPASGAATGPTVLFYDTFTDADGTLLTAHTPDIGGTWVDVPIVGATDIVVIDILANRARSRVQGQRGKVTVSDIAASAVFSADVTWVTGSFPGIVVRSNILTLTNNRHFACLLGNNRIAIYEFLGTGYTLRAFTALTLVNGTTYSMALTVSGQGITGAVGASSVTFNSSANLTNTFAGITDGSGAVLTTFFDNFQAVSI